MDACKQVLSSLSEVAHQKLRALCVDILSADNVVFLSNVWELVSEALSVKIFFGVRCLMVNNLVGHYDVLVTALFAWSQRLKFLFVASVEAIVISSLNHTFQ